MMKIFSALAFAALMLWTASASAQSSGRNWFWSGPDVWPRPTTPTPCGTYVDRPCKASSRQPKTTKRAKSRNARR
jgi:hypothetical protein